MVQGLKNQYRPSALAPNAYGWAASPRYQQADVPTALMDRPAGVTSSEFIQQFAYEWYQSGDRLGFGGLGFSNPPFVGAAAGRLLPSLRTGSMEGFPPRILRGYIRRAQFDPGVANISQARLYFMYNPETITRDYVSYLDQTALDPFNTVYQSGNLVAPPSILDFSFELFFDRQEEATAADHPGVYVDYQFFDMVVRNVIPTDPQQTSNTLPDNGVMMVNPRNITVVFSPQFTVEGRPLNARVTFEKFTHRMVPIRMRIALTIRAVYMGPVRDMTEYKAEEFAAEAAIPTDEITRPPFIFNIQDVQESATVPQTGDPSVNTDYNNQAGVANGASSRAAVQALNWAVNHVTSATTYAGAGAGSARYNLPTSADCSGLVAAAYVGIGQAFNLGWQSYPGTAEMDRLFRANNFTYATKFMLTTDLWNKTDAGVGLQAGDLLFRINPSGGVGHVKFFVSKNGNNLLCFDAAGHTATPQVGYHTSPISAHADYSYAVRPLPIGGDMSFNALNN